MTDGQDGKMKKAATIIRSTTIYKAVFIYKYTLLKC